MDEPGSFDIRQIVKAELWRNFEELEECDLYSSKHCRGKRETSAQLDTLRDTVDDVWTSLKILCETDIEKLGLPYLNSKKQDALKEAIQTRQLDKDFLGRSLRVQWIDYLAEKKRKEQQKLRKLRQQTRQTNSFQTVMVTQQNTCRAMEPGSPLAEDKPEDLKPQTVTFPLFEDLIGILLNKLISHGFLVHRLKNYKNEFQASGFESLDILQRVMMKCIPCEVKELQGHKVTLERLEKVFNSQSPVSEWPKVGGYLAYVTSCNSTHYWRPYIGQSGFLDRRIEQHVTETLNGNQKSLLYWVASKQRRKLNFINLWKVLDEDVFHGYLTNQRVELLNNLLEMLFCLCFKSLPLPTLQTFLEEKIECSSLRGLNVVCPLLQGIKLSSNERAKIRSTLRFSPSVETKEFMIHREQQLRETHIRVRPSKSSPSYNEIRDAFLMAIPDGISAPFLDHSLTLDPKLSLNLERKELSSEPLQLETIRNNTVSYLKHIHVPEALWALPVGSLKSRIGFVLDFDIQSTQEYSDLPPPFPSVLDSIGFKETNCLLWPFNFQTTHIPRRIVIAHQKTCQEINRQIIDASDIQVIILCGPNAQDAVLLSSFEKVNFQIRAMSFDAFLETVGRGSERMIQRVYLRLPAVLSKIYSSHWQMSTRISLVIKTAACLTQTENICPYYFNSMSAISEIVVARLHEEAGKYMTINMITDNIWSWLYLRGFDSDDIIYLSKITGSISRALLLVLLTSPKRPHNKTHLPRARPFQKPDQPLFCYKFPKEHLQIAREFHSRKLQQKEDELKTLDTWQHQLLDDISPGSLGEGEVSDDCQAVLLNTITFEECMGLSMDYCEAKTSEMSLKMPFPKARKKLQRAPKREVKNPECAWCRQPTSTERSSPCWNSYLGGSVCQHCSMTLSNSGYLPIYKFMILHLDIKCGFCRLPHGPGPWRFVKQKGLPFCSPECRTYAGLKISDQTREAIHRKNSENINPSWVRWQDEMANRLPSSKELRAYFQDFFGLDTSPEGIRKNGVIPSSAMEY